MTNPTPERPPFRLADEERADLFAAYRRGLYAVEDWATDLAESYHDAGLVEGDLLHDGTVRWEAQA